MNNEKRKQPHHALSKSVGQALRAAARRARKTAKMYGTPIYIWQDGKIVAKKP